MSDPIFEITDPRNGDILVYNAAINRWVNIPEAPRLTRLRINISAALLGDGFYHFQLGEAYTVIAEIVGIYYSQDIVIQFAFVANGDYPLLNQYEPSNVLTPEPFELTIKAGTRFATKQIVFNNELDTNQSDEVYGVIFTTYDLPNEIIIDDDEINNAQFVLSADPVNPTLNRKVWYGYSNNPTTPTQEQLDSPDIGGTWRYQSVYLTNPIDYSFAVVCDSPILQNSVKYYWVVYPESFTLDSVVDFDASTVLPYQIDGINYTAVSKQTNSTYLIIK